MKILQVSNSDINGGAARAAYRLHRGLIAIQQDSLMLTLNRQSGDESVIKIDQPATSIPLSTLQKRYINHNRTTLSNTSFSLPYPGIDLTHHLANADIINLHWVAYFQSPVTIHHLLKHKPVIWTLHDMWAFTGGCHYSAGCTQYQQDCATCPQLQADPDGLTAAILQDKLALLQGLVIVTPSQWLADCARRSRVFRHHRIEVIPYGLETDVFSPLDKTEAKRELGLNGGAIALLIGADNGNEQRKGFAKLLQALKICAQNPQFQALLSAQKIQLLCFGIPNDQLTELNLPLHSFGRIDEDTQLRKIYAAADLFVLPSLEDNFPNTMLEAMSCGTPVIAFEVGGIPDVVKDGVTGRTVPLGDVSTMAAAILDCVLADDVRRRLGEASRRVMAEQYGLVVQAQHYMVLYEDVKVPHPSFPGSAWESAWEGKLEALPPEPGGGRASERHSQAPPGNEMGERFAEVFYPLAMKVMGEELKETRKEARQQLERSQAQLQELRDRLNAMETSKFWKLRSRWFKLKRWLGLPVDEG
jgi:glycosyltransferase involved in cell wall biosynthesis